MKRRLLLGLVLLLIGVVGSSAQVPEPMRPARLVNDFARLFSAEQLKTLEDSLVSFDRATSTQIAVVTLDDLSGYTPNEMATSIIEKWGVGREGKDNGIVVLLKPRNDTKGEVYIAVGSGLEGVLNDAKAGRLIDAVMLESLKDGDFYTAALKGTAELRGIVRGEFSADKYEEEGGYSIWAITIVLIFIVILFGRGKKGRGGGSNNSSGGSGGGPILWGGGGFGGGRSSSGGGGFGGFGGGGSFGGGGGRSF